MHEKQVTEGTVAHLVKSIPDQSAIQQVSLPCPHCSNPFVLEMRIDRVGETTNRRCERIVSGTCGQGTSCLFKHPINAAYAKLSFDHK